MMLLNLCIFLRKRITGVSCISSCLAVGTFRKLATRCSCIPNTVLFERWVDERPLTPTPSTCLCSLPLEESGLAWIEVIEQTADGERCISQPHPMFITVICELGPEVSTVFEGCSREEAVQRAGILKDMEDLFHPFDPDAPLQPCAFAPLLLTAVQKGWHDTLDEIADVVVERGGKTGMAELLTAADELLPHDILTNAVMSASAATMQVVFDLFLCAQLPLSTAAKRDGDGMTALHHAALRCDAEMVRMLLAESEDAPIQWHQDRARGCGKTPAQLWASLGEVDGALPPAAGVGEEADATSSTDSSHLLEPPSVESKESVVWGQREMVFLMSPLSVIITSPLIALLLSCFPWGRAQVAAHVLLLALALHVYLPLLHRLAYLQPLVRLQAIAAAASVRISTSRVRCCDERLQAKFEQFAVLRMKSWAHRGLFICWLLFTCLGGPLLAQLRSGYLNWRYSALQMLGGIVATRSLNSAIDTGRLAPVQWTFAAVGIASVLYWVCLSTYALKTHQLDFPLPRFLLPGGQPVWIRMMAASLFGVVPLHAARAYAMCVPMHALFPLRVLCSLLTLFLGYVMYAYSVHVHELSSPYLWVTGSLVEVFYAFWASVAARHWLECRMLQSFLAGSHFKSE